MLVRLVAFSFLFFVPFLGAEVDDEPEDFSTHPGACRSAIRIEPTGDFIHLDDGSIWVIRDDDQEIVKHWLSADELYILPNTRWFPDFAYIIKNHSTKEVVETKWKVPPLYEGNQTYWIASLDKENNKLRLNDGSYWNIARLDHAEVLDWMEREDTLMIGVNNGWFSSLYPNILINIKTKSYAQGKCLDNDPSK